VLAQTFVVVRIAADDSERGPLERPFERRRTTDQVEIPSKR
jgi:hypothetical protein